MERGTVSMRVAFVLRSAEVQPLFQDLCGDGLFGNVSVVVLLLLALLFDIRYDILHNNDNISS